MPIEAVAGTILALTTAAHLASVASVAWRLRPTAPRPVPADRPPVSIVRPLRGLENHLEATLERTFALDWPDYEILFCVADADDPVIPLVERLIARHPEVPARLLLGDDPISINPKLNNTVKGFRAARHGWILMIDSNVVAPPDLLARLFAAWRPDTGLVCSPPVGSQADGFWAELECAFLGTYQTRVQLFADLIGHGFAQGKVMLYRADILAAIGGIEALAVEPAEDAATTKLLRERGFRIRLVRSPFAQALGRRTFAEVWNRQVRWARLRRDTFPLYYLPEILAGALPPSSALLALAPVEGWALGPALLALLALWYGAEAALARIAGWQLSLRSLPAMLLRDLLLPAVWLAGWLGNGFVWRGNAMRLAGAARTG